ncbi:Delta-1-pyrroline-5-carboxylate dehydrogenase 12A1 [Durusdinium trenchii]|uniref:Mitochondrial (AtP5CDH) (P5C dehydrogenase) (Aldehyde dehydrogenase family 12 member A1) (L-glutamate gamma-semialdehyde dehydrogenase) n=1 Tax=Durusdinium trenchii TaxID=1381693 RepID=A0ABP0NQD0_9DINO
MDAPAKWHENDWDAVFAGKAVAQRYYLRSGLVRKDRLLHFVPSKRHPTTRVVRSLLELQRHLQELGVRPTRLDRGHKEAVKYVLKKAQSSNASGIRFFTEEEADAIVQIPTEPPWLALLGLVALLWTLHATPRRRWERRLCTAALLALSLQQLRNAWRARKCAGELLGGADVWVLQRNVTPYLHEGRKFHLRALLLCVGDLTAYLHEEVRVLLATQPYNDQDGNREAVHVTNMGVNQEVTGYSESKQNMSLDELGEVSSEIFQQLCEVLTRTLNNLRTTGRRHFFTLPNCWELFGVDFLVNSAREVLLLEVNPSPSLAMYRGSYGDLLGVESPLQEPLPSLARPETMSEPEASGGLTPYALDAASFVNTDETERGVLAMNHTVFGCIAQAVARPLTSLARHGASRRAFAAPGWATVDPETMSAAQPAEGMNLCWKLRALRRRMWGRWRILEQIETFTGDGLGGAQEVLAFLKAGASSYIGLRWEDHRLRCGMDAAAESERATKNDFATNSVQEALKLNWAETDLRRLLYWKPMAEEEVQLAMGSLLQTGKASIDLAATSTVEGVDAMSRVMSINEGQGLQRDIKVDVMGTPSFRQKIQEFGVEPSIDDLEAFYVELEDQLPRSNQDIVDPLNGDAFLKVPNTGLDEIEPFVQRMASVPRSGLHNPFKNPDRYVMLGEVCGAAAREMFKPEVSDYFCRLIQRVAPKSYAQAGGEIKAVRTWLQDYSGNSVRMLAESQGLPGDHPGQSTVGYRMPFGGVSVITPFNFPLEICSLQTLSAVFMGNQCTTKVDWKVAIVMEQFLRMLHACGLPKADVDYIYCDGPVFNEVLLRGDAKMTLFTGSQRVADKLAVELKGKVKLEDAGFDWKILGPDVMDVDFVAWQADHDAYGFAGQKCSAQSMLFMHERLGQRQVDIVGRLAKLAGQRSLENLTNCPVLTWPTEKILDHMERCLSIPGATLAFGGQPLTGHRIPPQYGAVEPTAVRLPIEAERGTANEALEDSGSFDMATTELFGPFQVLVDYKEGQQSKVIEAINRMPNHLTAGIVSNNPIFINEVLGNSITGTTYAGARARTTGAPVQHWFGPSGDVRAGGIHTKHAIQLCRLEDS